MSMIDQFNSRIQSAHDKGDEVISLLAQQNRLIDTLIQQVDAIQEQDEYVRRTGSATVAADGTAEISLNVRQGFVTKLLGFATTAPRAGTGFVGFFLGSSDNNQNLVYATAGAQMLSDIFPEGTLLPEGAFLVARFTGLNAGDVVTAAVNGKRLRLHIPVSVPGVPY